MNSVQLIGRLTATPELKMTQSGVATTRFTIAVDRRYQKKGEEKQADFIGCTAWRQTAEFICKYFTKGRRIAIQGSIRTGSYENAEGRKVFTFDVDVDNAEFIDSNNSSNEGSAISASAAAVDNLIESADDGDIDDSTSNLPF